MVKWKKLSAEHIEMVRHWRMRPEITKGMYTDPVISESDQIKWFERVSNDPAQMYWVVYEDDKPVGLASIVHIDDRNKSCETGVYFAEKHDFTTVMINTATFLKLVFDVFDLNRLESNIMSNNKRVVRYHELQGFVTEGIRRKAIYKNGEFFDIYVQSILKEEWQSGKFTERVGVEVAEVEL